MNKRYTKDGKSFYTPIKIEKEVEFTVKEKNEAGDEIEVKKTKKVVQYTNVEKLILEAGYKVFQPPKMSVESLVMRSVNSINRQTDEKILNGFIYNGNEFYLSMENQFNFKNLYDLRDQREYPVTVKTKSGFIALNNAEEVADFYLSGVMFIENCLKEGWEKKAAAEEKIRKEYK